MQRAPRRRAPALRSLVVEFAASRGDTEMLRCAGIFDGIDAAACSDATRLWLLHAHLVDALPAPTRSSSTNPACSRLLTSALAYLARLRVRECDARHGDGAWPDVARAALLDASVACWRQALLLPLRASPIDWLRFVELVPAVPPAAAAALAPQLGQLTHPAGRLCRCSHGALARLKPSTCASPHTCTEIHRRVQGFLVLHPPSEIAAPLAHLLTVLRDSAGILPEAWIMREAAAELAAGAAQAAAEASRPAAASHLAHGEARNGRKRARHGGPQVEAPERQGEESDVEDIDEGCVRVVIRSVDVLDD